MYLTYAEYQKFGGTLDEAAFLNYESTAEGTVNKYTYSRLLNDTTVPDAVKRVVFNLIGVSEQQQQITSTNGGAIASQSNDGVSVSYSSMTPENIYQNLESQKQNIIMDGLFGVKNSKGHKLLFKGMYADE